MEALVKQPGEANTAQPALHQELMGALTAGRVGVAAGAAVSCLAPSLFLLNQTGTHNREAYL